MREPKIAATFTIQPPSGGLLSGKGYVEVPSDCELWFYVVLSTKVNLTVGGVTFGGMVCLSDGSSYYPMENNGFHTVDRAVIPKTSNPPMNAVVTFFGQCASGRLGIVNTTDGAVEVKVLYAPRTFQERE